MRTPILALMTLLTGCATISEPLIPIPQLVALTPSTDPHDPRPVTDLRGKPCEGPKGQVFDRVFLITEDGGGCAHFYHKAMLEAAEAGLTPVVAGKVGSAATQWLGIPGACVTDTAKLEFHGLTEDEGWDAETREQFLKRHPPKLQRWMRVNRVLEKATNEFTVLEGERLFKIIPKCEKST